MFSPSRLRQFTVLAVAALLVLGAVGAARADRGATRSRRVPAPQRTRAAANRLYWGAWIGSQLTGTEAPWDMGAVSAFEQLAGKGVSLVNFSSPFENCHSTPCSSYPFPAAEFTAIRNHGAIPFFSWASDSLPVSVNEPGFRLSTVVDGAFDGYIRSWATAARQWGHPFFLRFNWEMNSDWFPWAENANGNRPGDFVRAWRHVHDIFASVGATNVTWVWCANVDPYGKMTRLAELYPGDSYVDWTCLDGYSRNSSTTSFRFLFTSTYRQITQTIAPSKPMVIGETAASENGGAKAAWITDLLKTDLPSTFPHVKAVLWFDKHEQGDWPIESSAAATAAFAKSIALPNYAGNQFASLPGSGPVQPLP